MRDDSLVFCFVCLPVCFLAYTYTVELTTALGSITSLPVSVTISEGELKVPHLRYMHVGGGGGVRTGAHAM